MKKPRTLAEVRKAFPFGVITTEHILGYSKSRPREIFCWRPRLTQDGKLVWLAKVWERKLFFLWGIFIWNSGSPKIFNMRIEHSHTKYYYVSKPDIDISDELIGLRTIVKFMKNIRNANE